jgi:hypothetical protein
MLENLRKQGASIVIYAIFGILIAVFVINFGAQSVGTSQGCRSSDEERVASVDGADVGMAGWRWVQNVLKAEGQPTEQRAIVAFEWLIQREILVDEAARRGMYVSDDLVDKNLERGRIYFAGSQAYFLVPYFIDKDGFFIYEPDLSRAKDDKAADDEPPGLTSLARNFGMSMATFKEQQRKETLAAMMRMILVGEPRASIDEARASWLYSNSSVDVQVLELKPKTYADAMLPTDGDLDAWAKAHDADVKAAFEKPTTVHVRQIWLPKAPKTAAPAGAGSGSGAGAVTLPPDAQLGAARSLLEGGKKFEDVAKMGVVDAKHPTDLGWRPSDAPGLASSVLDRAVTNAAPQGLSQVVAQDDGYYLFQVDVADKPTYDKLDAGTKRELTRVLARAAWGDEAAKRAALAALDKAKSAKSLSDIYPPLASEPAPSPTGPAEHVPETPGAPAPAPAPGKAAPAPGKAAPAPTAPAEKTGRLELETPDEPAVWGADDVAPPAGGAAHAPAPGAKPAPAPAAPPELKASSETLPSMTPVTPHAVRFAEVTRFGSELPFALTPELSKAVFDDLGEHQIAPRVFQVEGEYVLVEVARKNLPDDKMFEKTADRAVANLAAERGQRHYLSFLRDRCEALSKAGKIKWDTNKLTRDDGKGGTVQVPYRPCISLAAPEAQGLPPE